MYPRVEALLAGGLLMVCIVAAAPAPQSVPPPRIDLAKLFAAGKLRVVNREAAKLPDPPDGLHVSERPDPGLVWIEGSEFSEGTIEVDVRGRDQFQRSFLGIAFHGKDDKTYESVYLRPFNFRAEDPARHRHALQYMALPDFDWPRLRQEFPEEFERPVDSAIVPTGWVTLRVVVHGPTIQVYAGPGKTPALEARKLGKLDRGMVGLWTGNNSDGDFANLRITPAR